MVYIFYLTFHIAKQIFTYSYSHCAILPSSLPSPCSSSCPSSLLSLLSRLSMLCVICLVPVWPRSFLSPDQIRSGWHDRSTESFFWWPCSAESVFLFPCFVAPPHCVTSPSNWLEHAPVAPNLERRDLFLGQLRQGKTLGAVARLERKLCFWEFSERIFTDVKTKKCFTTTNHTKHVDWNIIICKLE